VAMVVVGGEGGQMEHVPLRGACGRLSRREPKRAIAAAVRPPTLTRRGREE
jgi:hypothetical protein